MYMHYTGHIIPVHTLQGMDSPINGSSDDDVFITQNTYKADSSGNNTETIIDTILDMESDTKLQTFDLKNPMFSDISDDELIRSTDSILKASQMENIAHIGQKRFQEPMADKERENLSKSRFAKKTDAKSRWAVNLFNGWLNSRRILYADRHDIKHVTGDLLSMDCETLDYALGAFVFEVRKENGDEYRGNTIYEIIVALQHFLRENGRFLTLLDDAEFEGMRRNLDKKMKDLAAKGVGIEKQQSNVISMDDEIKMWQNGVLGSDTPDKLRDTLLYLLGLNFALRGGQEHYNLRHGVNSQLKLGADKDDRKFLEYFEDVSKCNPGGINHRRITKKHTKAYENTFDPSKCIVALYQKYISLRPRNGLCSAFYLRSLSKPSATQWYADVRVGINKLSKVVKSLCGKAGIEGYYTNHSSRATAATRIYEANLPEQLICEKTGHRSDAVRSYKRTSTAQEKFASDVVQGIKRKIGNEENQSVESENQQIIKIRKGDISIDIPV